MNRNKSLRFNIWLYFMLFIMVVFLLLWIFQILFLEGFYKRMKINDIENIAIRVREIYNTDGYESELSEIAQDNNICIQIRSKYYSVEYPYGDICLLGQDNCLIHSSNTNFSINVFLNEIRESKTGEIRYIFNIDSDTEILLFGSVLGDVQNPVGYFIINSPLAPVESSVSIIKRQMYFISVLLIVLGFIISLFASKMISEPLAQITKSARKLAKGNYNINFEGEGYHEVYELAQTLNYASKEISRVDTLQRDLIANVSHDLRTPLTMLKAYAEMIRDLSGDNPQKRDEHLKIIIDETDRLALLVNDMLDLSKIESGGIELHYTFFNIREKLEEILDRYKGISQQMGYNIFFEGDEEIEVYCDAGKIEQVIYNLINNAINYTGEDKNVFVKQINQSDGVRIEVRDTGQGISEDNIKLIFDKYYRSSNHKREVLGTGLGLSIVKAILKKHNFAYGVQSTIGKGSIFWFKIKYADKIIEDKNRNT